MKPALGRGAASLALFVVLALAFGSAAAQEVVRISITDAPPGTPSLGAGVRVGSGPYAEAELQLDLVPLYLYEGKWLYAHGTSAGVHFYRNKRFSFDGFIRYRFLKLDPDDNELTRTRKVRRAFVADKYKALIDGLYSDASAVDIEAEVTYEDGRKGTLKATLTIEDVTVTAPTAKAA